MCEATTIILAAGVAISAMSAVAQQQASSAQADAAGRSAEEQGRLQNLTVEASNDAFVTSLERANRSVEELRSSTGADSVTKTREFLEARASALAHSEGAGVTGVSVNALLQDFQARFGEQRSSTGTNFARQVQAAEDDIFDLHADAVSRAHGVAPPARVARPTTAGLVLNVGGSAFNAFARGRSAQRQSPTTPPPTTPSEFPTDLQIPGS